MEFTNEELDKLAIYVEALIEDRYDKAVLNLDNAVKDNKISKAQAKLELQSLEENKKSLIEKMTHEDNLDIFFDLPGFCKTIKLSKLNDILQFKIAPYYQQLMQAENQITKEVDKEFELIWGFDEKTGEMNLIYKDKFKTYKLGNF